jgi:hypothetical protein
MSFDAFVAFSGPGGDRGDRGEVERFSDHAMSSTRTQRLLRSGLLVPTARAGWELASSARELAGGRVDALAGLVGDWDIEVRELVRARDRRPVEAQCLRIACHALAVALLAGAEHDATDDYDMLHVGWLPIHAIGVANSPREMRALRSAPERQLADDCDQAQQLLARATWLDLADCAARASARALILALDDPDRL